MEIAFCSGLPKDSASMRGSTRGDIWLAADPRFTDMLRTPIFDESGSDQLALLINRAGDAKRGRSSIRCHVGNLYG
jgi:hypothetical protein